MPVIHVCDIAYRKECISVSFSSFTFPSQLCHVNFQVFIDLTLKYFIWPTWFYIAENFSLIKSWGLLNTGLEERKICN